MQLLEGGRKGQEEENQSWPKGLTSFLEKELCAQGDACSRLRLLLSGDVPIAGA